MVETNFLPMATIVALHHKHKHMNLVKPFIPHVIVWSVRKGYSEQFIEQKAEKGLQCLAQGFLTFSDHVPLEHFHR